MIAGTTKQQRELPERPVRAHIFMPKGIAQQDATVAHSLALGRMVDPKQGPVRRTEIKRCHVRSLKSSLPESRYDASSIPSHSFATCSSVCKTIMA